MYFQTIFLVNFPGRSDVRNDRTESNTKSVDEEKSTTLTIAKEAEVEGCSVTNASKNETLTDHQTDKTNLVNGPGALIAGDFGKQCKSLGDLEVSFSLPPSAYATVCLREIMKSNV